MWEKIVILNTEEEERARALARERDAFDKAHGFTDRAFGDPEEIGINGFRAEIAVLKACGGKHMNEHRLEGDGGIDLVLDSGKSVQVKFRRRDGYEFMIPRSNPYEFKADIGVLVYPHGERLVLAGYMTRDDWFAYSLPVNRGHGLHRMFPNGKLRPISEILKKEEIPF